MAVKAKCPKCDKMLSSVRLQAIRLDGTHHYWKGLSYLCPLCGAVLNVGYDPIALQADTVSDVVREVLRALDKD